MHVDAVSENSYCGVNCGRVLPLANSEQVRIGAKKNQLSFMFHRKLSYSMRIDSAERFVFSFTYLTYLNAQFRAKTQFTFRMKKVELSLLVDR